MWEIATARRLRAGLVMALLGMALAASPASAANPRYASPSGTNTTDCPISDPCDLADAMNGTDVVDGDTVIVLPGNYTLSRPYDSIDEQITIEGQPGQAMPHIQGSDYEVLDLESSVTVRRLWIEQTGNPDSLGLYIGVQGGGSVVERSLVQSATTEACFVEAPSATLTDTACITTDDGFAALEVNGGLNQTMAVTLRNVTAIGGQGDPSPAIAAHASDSGAHVSIDGRNVIARGGTSDVLASASGDVNDHESASITLASSNYETELEEGGGTVTDPGTGGNQTAQPLLDTDNYHQLASSPTVNAGSAAPDVGSADIDDEARISGTAVDIGADELQQATPQPQPQPNPGPTSNPGPTPRCHGKTATIAGTGGVLNGTPKRDVIVGSARRDVIRAGGGADLVCARGGNDKVLGGGGKDTLAGEAGRDRLIGGAARDVLLGGGGKDILFGGGGRDLLRGGPGIDLTRQ